MALNINKLMDGIRAFVTDALGKSQRELRDEWRKDLKARDSLIAQVQRRVEMLHKDVNGERGNDSTLRDIRAAAEEQRRQRGET